MGPVKCVCCENIRGGSEILCFIRAVPHSGVATEVAHLAWCVRDNCCIVLKTSKASWQKQLILRFNGGLRETKPSREAVDLIGR